MEALFSVGQKVVCVNSSAIKGVYQPPPLIEGKVYTVKSIRKCDCGNVRVDVGLKINEIIIQYCNNCEKHRKTFSWYCSQYRFVPLDDNDALEDEIRESLNLHLKV